MKPMVAIRAFSYEPKGKKGVRCEVGDTVPNVPAAVLRSLCSAGAIRPADSPPDELVVIPGAEQYQHSLPSAEAA